MITVEEGDSCCSSSRMPLFLLTDAVHNFLDGVAAASTYRISPYLGISSAIAIFLHEIPHQLGDFGLMLRGDSNIPKVMLIQLMTGTTTMLGALFGRQLHLIIQHSEVTALMLKESLVL